MTSGPNTQPTWSTGPCTPAAKAQIAALWLGPDEWLLTWPAPEAPGLVGSLRAALADVHAAAKGCCWPPVGKVLDSDIDSSFSTLFPARDHRQRIGGVQARPSVTVGLT